MSPRKQNPRSNKSDSRCSCPSSLRELRTRLRRLLVEFAGEVDRALAENPAIEQELTCQTIAHLSRVDNGDASYILLRVASRPFKELTPRENEIAQLAAEGLRNDAIASRLDISKCTVAAHMRQIFFKLSIKNRMTLVRRTMLLS